MCVSDRLGAIGDVTGIWPLTHVGEYAGEVVAANILGEPREASFEAVPRVTYTDPQAAAVGATDAPFSATAKSSGSQGTDPASSRCARALAPVGPLVASRAPARVGCVPWRVVGLR